MAVGNNPNSPRQKMINLMYIVFIAMMALNVSSEVLDGFGLVEDSLLTSIMNTTNRNKIVENELQKAYDNNQSKAQQWYDKGRDVNIASDSLYNYIQDLKVRIVKVADGKDGNVNNIDHKDDLEAASRIMLAPINGEGEVLRENLDTYRTIMTGMVDDPSKKSIIEESLSTKAPKQVGLTQRKWEEALFENMPVAAAVTLLTKLQSDIRYAQGEVLANLVNQVDMGDSRVNLIKPQVIPDARFVVSGTNYNANVVLSAIDSTQIPEVYWEKSPNNFVRLDNGKVSIPTSGTGTSVLKGYIEAQANDGSPIKYNFEENYLVIEPSATVAPTLMNVLYAPYNNPIRIAVPGVPNASINASITNGKLNKTGNGEWVAIPDVGATEAIVTVTATIEGRSSTMGTQRFRVLPLPDPVAYIDYKDANGNTRRFRGGTIAKRNLMSVDGILAGYVDGLLDAKFTVLRFDLNYFDSFGLMISETSQSTNFTDRQKDYIRNLARGKRFYISNIVVRDPSGAERRLESPLEITVNQ